MITVVIASSVMIHNNNALADSSLQSTEGNDKVVLLSDTYSGSIKIDSMNINKPDHLEMMRLLSCTQNGRQLLMAFQS